MYTLQQIGMAAASAGMDARLIGESLRRYINASDLASVPPMPTSATTPANLRDYFIAHAPQEPQPWFEPAMPPKPEIPRVPEGWSSDQRSEYNSWRNGARDVDELELPDVRAFAERADATRLACDVWEQQRFRERYLQWPAAWADEQLRRRADWIEREDKPHGD